MVRGTNRTDGLLHELLFRTRRRGSRWSAGRGAALGPDRCARRL